MNTLIYSHTHSHTHTHLHTHTDDRVSFTQGSGDRSSTLTISPLLPVDNGTYNCIADNIVDGFDKKSVDVTVLCKCVCVYGSFICTIFGVEVTRLSTHSLIECVVWVVTCVCQVLSRSILRKLATCIILSLTLNLST